MFYIEINKNAGADHADRVDENILPAGIDHAGDAGDHRNEFRPGSLMNVVEELLGDLLQQKKLMINLLPPPLPLLRGSCVSSCLQCRLSG